MRPAHSRPTHSPDATPQRKTPAQNTAITQTAIDGAAAAIVMATVLGTAEEILDFLLALSTLVAHAHRCRGYTSKDVAVTANLPFVFTYSFAIHGRRVHAQANESTILIYQAPKQPQVNAVETRRAYRGDRGWPLYR